MSLNSILSEQSSLGVSYSDLLDAVEAGTINELLEPYLKGKTSDQIEEFMSTILEPELDEIKEKIKEYKDVLEGKEAGSEYEEEQIDLDLENCEEVLDQIGDVDDEVEVAVLDYQMHNLVSDQDLSVTLNDYSIFTGNQELNVTGIGEYENLAEAELTDLDGDGIITGRDYELQMANDQATLLESSQDFFINLGNSYRLTGIQYDSVTGQITQLTFESQGQIMTINIDGPMNVFLEAQSLELIPESIYSSLPQSVLERLYIGDGSEGSGTTSVWNALHPLTMEEKVEMTQGRDEIIAEETLNLAASYLPEGIDVEHVKDLTKQSLDLLFEYLNATDGLTTMASQWADIQSLLSGETPEVAAAVVEMLVIAVANKGDQVYFQTFFTGTVPSIIENIILDAGPYTEFGIAVAAMIEMWSGSSGNYGGTNLLIPVVAGGEVPQGSVFLEGSAGDISLVHSDWANMPTVLGGLKLYQELILSTGWMADDGSAQAIIDAISNNVSLAEGGVSSVMTKEYLDELDNAAGWHYSESTDSHLTRNEADTGYWDGISDGELTAAIDLCIGNFMTTATAGEALSFISMAKMVEILKETVDGYTENQGDIAAGIIFVLSKKCPSLLKAMFVADPGLQQWLLGKINAENDQWKLLDNVRPIISNYQTEASRIRQSLEDEEEPEPTETE